MRCKACNEELDRIVITEQGDIDLCPVCRDSSEDEYSYLKHEYLFENLRDGPTPPLDTSNY